jgi:hypothetical protein
MKNRHPRALAAAVLLLAAGCGGGDGFGARHAVSGKVTLDGGPMKTGTVVFSPAADGPSARGDVFDGAYSIRQSEGPGAGPYRVEVYSVQPTGKKVYDAGERQTIEETVNLVAPEFNANSTLKLDVPASGSVEYNIDVKSPATKKGK